MARQIKRYESRKLYDSGESRYVSLQELAQLIRAGEEVEVVDNASGADVTVQTLTQVILEEGRKGRSLVSSSALHELLRKGEAAISTGVEHARQGMDRLVQSSMNKLGPVKEARTEMELLRSRLDKLEASLEGIEAGEEEDNEGSQSNESSTEDEASAEEPVVATVE
jgi:polyhydroxyalkanoate synthesis repressor PhaR